MSTAKDQLPKDLRDFLATKRNASLKWGHPYPVEVEEATFFGIDELPIRSFKLHTHEYYLNHGEPGKDPGLWYDITGIDLIKDVSDYEPEGMLVWFPQFSEYGAWDADHGTITMMPEVSWTEILKEPAKYVNVQWYPKRVKHYLLRPWRDNRCASLQPHKDPSYLEKGDK
jgi:hypothetical protein